MDEADFWLVKAPSTPVMMSTAPLLVPVPFPSVPVRMLGSPPPQLIDDNRIAAMNDVDKNFFIIIIF